MPAAHKKHSLTAHYVHDSSDGATMHGEVLCARADNGLYNRSWKAHLHASYVKASVLCNETYPCV